MLTRLQQDFREAHAGAHFERHHRLGADDSSFEVLSDRDVEAGGGLYEDYGDNSNTMYVARLCFAT